VLAVTTRHAFRGKLYHDRLNPSSCLSSLVYGELVSKIASHVYSSSFLVRSFTRDKQASKLACAPGHSTTHWRQSHHLTDPTGPRSRACWSIVSQRSTGTTLLKTACLAAGVRQSRLRLWAVLWLGGVKSLPFFLPCDFRGHGVFGGCQHWHWRFLDLEAPVWAYGSHVYMD
jgi:hypothetical protein